MRAIDEHNAEAYLRHLGWVSPAERVSVRTLVGGVSNQVLYVRRLDRQGGDFVVKQARPQLRTPDPWFSSVERVWREVEVLKVCQGLLAAQTAVGPGADDGPGVTTPSILDEDRDNYAFAMTAAPADHRVWKAELLAGRTDPRVARACGLLLGRLHAGTWQDAAVERRLADRRNFDELRLDPYYRFVARAHPAYAGAFERLIRSVWDHRRSLVHADFSPKNLLVFAGGMMMVDFETGHYGDPAFDLGFFTSHLVLKAACRAPGHEPYLALTERFWEAYESQLAARIGPDEWAGLVRRALANFAGCAWARLDGTSQVDYLVDPARRERIRSLCRGVFDRPPASWDELLVDCRERLAGLETADAGLRHPDAQGGPV